MGNESELERACDEKRPAVRLESQAACPPPVTPQLGDERCFVVSGCAALAEQLVNKTTEAKEGKGEGIWTVRALVL